MKTAKEAAWELVTRNTCIDTVCKFQNGCGCSDEIIKALNEARREGAEAAEARVAELEGALKKIIAADHHPGSMGDRDWHPDDEWGKFAVFARAELEKDDD